MIHVSILSSNVLPFFSYSQLITFVPTVFSLATFNGSLSRNTVTVPVFSQYCVWNCCGIHCVLRHMGHMSIIWWLLPLYWSRQCPNPCCQCNPEFCWCLPYPPSAISLSCWALVHSMLLIQQPFLTFGDLALILFQSCPMYLHQLPEALEINIVFNVRVSYRFMAVSWCLLFSFCLYLLSTFDFPFYDSWLLSWVFSLNIPIATEALLSVAPEWCWWGHPSLVLMWN